MNTDIRLPAPWLLNGNPVTIANGANGIWNCFKPGQTHGWLVKEALASITSSSDSLPETLTVTELAYPVKAIVVPIVDHEPLWTVLDCHKSLDSSWEKLMFLLGLDIRTALAWEHKLSPCVFDNREQPRLMTNKLTIHLLGTVSQPIITRIYPGEPLPDLPWQDSPAEVAERVSFWKKHSFLVGSGVLASPPDGVHNRWSKPPMWYVAK